MITYIKGNLFLSPAKVLVNAVNTEGVMGKGIAKEFKNLFPQMFAEYQKICEKKLLKTGMLWIYKTPNKWVLNFPTKESWRKPSELSYIESGLKKFVDQYAQKGITSIAFPALGCGNGELNWETQVRPLIEKYLGDLPIDIYIHLFNPDVKEDLPEHKRTREISTWLQNEPCFLSFSEIYQSLKNTYTFNLNQTAEQNKISILFDEDENFIQITDSNKTVRWTREDLIDFISILRNHGLVTEYNVPPNLKDSFSDLVSVFSILPFISKTKATTEYSNMKEKKELLAIQLLPKANESSQNIIKVAPI